MGETSNIAEMAKIVFADLFQVFGWKQVGPEDENWACSSKEHEKKVKSAKKDGDGDSENKPPTHPSDVVFYYQDPYDLVDKYFNVDLKSYSASSLQLSKVFSAFQSLDRAVQCANAGEHWRKLYLQKAEQFDVYGLLFIFNHDGDYDRTLLERVKKRSRREDYKVSRGNRIFIIGPKEIEYLLIVVNDIESNQAKHKKNRVADLEEIKFWYPDTVRKRSASHEWPCATIEKLLGPWIIMTYTTMRSDIARPVKVYRIYYRDKGERPEEFTYLFDYLFRNQIIDKQTFVQIRLVNPAPEFSANFEKAITQYSEEISVTRENLETIVKRLKDIDIGSIKKLRIEFNSIEIGMEARGSV